MNIIRAAAAALLTAVFALSATAFAAEELSKTNESKFIARVSLYTLHDQLVSSGMVPWVSVRRFAMEKNGVTAKILRVALFESVESRDPVCRTDTLLKPEQKDWEISFSYKSGRPGASHPDVVCRLYQL